MKALLVARKSLIEISREGQLLLLELLLPLVFLGITAATYNTPLQATHPVQAVGPDPASEPLIQALGSQRYADGRPVFVVEPASDRGAAEAALKEREITTLLTVTPKQADQATRVTITGDPLYPRFYRASTILSSVIERYADALSGRPEVVRVNPQPLFAAGPQTEFDLYAPGIIVMALLMIVPQTAMLVAREVRWHTLRRLRLTPLGAGEFLAGISLAQMVVAGLQVVVIFLAALLMGFHNQGSLPLALLVGLALSFSAIGQGLVVACFVENDSQAANVGSTVTMLQVFLSGAFYRLPAPTLFSLGGYQIDLFDVFPASHGFTALQQVLAYGADLGEIGFRLTVTLLLSGLYLWVGVLAFKRLQMGR